LSRPEQALLPREPTAGAPVFAEPWHAGVLAVAYALTRDGVFSAAEWAEALGAEIARAHAAGAPDTEAGYYQAALKALESLVSVKSPPTGKALAERIEAWRRAYLNTPHGKPVTLAAATVPMAHHGHHHHD
jgi:nitrile hydratase accessory protein